MKIFSQINSLKNKGSPYLIYWLLSCATLIYAMIVLGGVTRLTHSGLSMVNWEPIMGVIPPLNAQDWQTLFYQYQQYPEFKMVHSTMGLAEFKRIFYFEYSHRLLGRFIGLAFIIPLIIFWIKGYLDRALLKKMLIIFILGGAQGVLGWYMVQSGLVDEPKVSQYRLTAHLGLAIALYGSLIWLATDLFLKNRLDKHTQGSIRISAHATMLLCFVFFMILSGGLVAGLKAGFVWNTFPLMGNTFIPPGLYEMAPFWISALEDMTTVQFNHRILAYIIFVVATVLLVRLMVNDSYAILQRVMLATYISLCCQIILGITTILFAVPVVIGSLHQACAVLVFTLVVVLTKLARFLELPS